jgi:hypothetical protein
LKSENPKMPLAEFREKKCTECARGFGVIFDTFSMLRQIATALFSIKTPKIRVFSGHFCILRFFAFCTFLFVTFRKKMSENVPISQFQVPAAQSVFCKNMFFGTISQFPSAQKCQGFRFQFRNFRIRPQRSEKHLFYTFISDYSLKLWKTPNVTSEFRCIFRDFRDFGKHILRIFDISGFGKSHYKSICFYILYNWF